MCILAIVIGFCEAENLVICVELFGETSLFIGKIKNVKKKVRVRHTIHRFWSTRTFQQELKGSGEIWYGWWQEGLSCWDCWRRTGAHSF
jgi:hypothetical protein